MLDPAGQDDRSPPVDRGTMDERSQQGQYAYQQQLAAQHAPPRVADADELPGRRQTRHVGTAFRWLCVGAAFRRP